MTKKDNINELIVKKLTDTINEEDNDLLNSKLDKHKSTARSYSVIETFWRSYFPKSKKHSIIQQTEKKLGFTYQESTRTSKWKWVGIAATLLLILDIRKIS